MHPEDLKLDCEARSLAKELWIDLCPKRGGFIQTTVNVNVDANTDTITSATLRTFEAYQGIKGLGFVLLKRLGSCPAEIMLTLRHPDFGTAAGDFVFEILHKPYQDVVLGGPTCREVVRRYKEENRISRIRESLEKRSERGSS